MARKTTHVSDGRAERGAEDAELRLLELGPLKARVAISRETVKPMPAIAPAPATAAQPTGGRSRPRLSRVTSQDAPTMPIGLPTT